MATRDLIRDIVEAGQATIFDPSSKTEVNDALITATIAACYALGELIDDLIRRVASLEERSVPADLGLQLDGIQEELLALAEAVKKSAKTKKKKGKKKKELELD